MTRREMDAASCCKEVEADSPRRNSRRRVCVRVEPAVPSRLRPDTSAIFDDLGTSSKVCGGDGGSRV